MYVTMKKYSQEAHLSLNAKRASCTLKGSHFRAETKASTVL